MEHRNPVLINEGNQDGVQVIVDHENRRAIIETPNNFDVYWMLSRRDNNGVPYAERHGTDNPSRAVFCVPFDELLTDNKVRDFNQKIGVARQVAKEVHSEVELYQTVVAFEHLDGNAPKYKYQLPETGYAIGDVVHAGKYFAVLGQGVKDGNKFFQVVNTSQLLQGKEEFANREEAVKAKLPIGSKKYLARPAGAAKITVADYKPKQTTEVTPTLPINREQKEALMAFRESHQEVWKEKLNAMWQKASYPGVAKAHAPLLQQVRNHQGPDWLANLKEKDLYIGKTTDPVQPEAAKVAHRSPRATKAHKLEQSM